MNDWKTVIRNSRLPGFAILPLRLFLGVSFIWASFDKLVDPSFFNPASTSYIGHQLQASAASSPLGGFLTGVAIPQATLFGMLTMAGELLIGLAVLLGWYTRFSAIMGLLINLMFYLTITWDVRPFYYGADIVFVFAWLTLALAGPGPYSVDAYLRQRLATAAAAASAAAPVRGGGPARGPAPQGATRGGRPVPAGSHRPTPGQAQGRSTRVQVAATSADMTRRQFTVLGAGALAAVVLGGMEMLAYPLLHRGGDDAAAQTPSGPTLPVGGPAPVAPTVATPTTAIAAAPPPAAPAAPTTAPQPGAPQPTAVPPTAVRPVVQPTATPAGIFLATPDQVPMGQAADFTDPTTGEPCVLVHLSSGFAAYVSICTHAGCTVQYLPSDHLLGCPCHGALFDPSQHASVVRGPARQPLAPVPLNIGADGNIYLAG